ncbi:MAG: pilus assembly protein [Parasphingorhabdus sp.]|nr:pilus assembly protein [Parasphingorhabdus sp.]
MEFAMGAPVLLTLGLGGMETANMAMTHMQVSQIAMLVADNASRVRTTIDEADINEVFTGAALTGDSIAFSDNARVILTSLEPNLMPAPKTGQWIRWQRCYGKKNYQSTYGNEGDGQYDASIKDGIGPAGRKVAAQSATAVNFVEVVYEYAPIIGGMFLSDLKMQYDSAFVARERDDQVLKNASNIPDNKKWLCNRYDTIAVDPNALN